MSQDTTDLLTARGGTGRLTAHQAGPGRADVVALIVIGPEKLPRVARTVGTLLGKAQRYVNDVKAEVNRSMDLDELRAVLAAGCTEVLLDNMSTADMAEAVRINEAAGSAATLEASGGLTLERAREVAETGVDFISVGALTHSVDVFDLGLDFRTSQDGP